MNRYNYIPEGCVARKAFSQTCWPEVQSESYKTILIVQQRQITCYLLFRKIGPQWDSCQTTFNYDGTVMHLTFARKSALHLGEKCVLCLGENGSSSTHMPHFCWEKRHFTAALLVMTLWPSKWLVCKLILGWPHDFLYYQFFFITFQRTNIWVHYHVS